MFLYRFMGDTVKSIDFTPRVCDYAVDKEYFNNFKFHLIKVAIHVGEERKPRGERISPD